MNDNLKIPKILRKGLAPVAPPEGGFLKLREKLIEAEGAGLRKSWFGTLWSTSRYRTAFVSALCVTLLVAMFPLYSIIITPKVAKRVVRVNDPMLRVYDMEKAPVDELFISEEDRSMHAVVKVPLKSDKVVMYWVAKL